jgi:hypothetical protein
VNPHQRAALAHVTYLGFECVHPRFRYLSAPLHSVVLTVNAGYE